MVKLNCILNLLLFIFFNYSGIYEKFQKSKGKKHCLKKDFMEI